MEYYSVTFLHFQALFVSILALLLPALFFSSRRKTHHHIPNPSMAVDWSQLPRELLHIISERLDSPLYLLRFRSVCSAWRSSASASASPSIPIHQFPFIFPPISDHNASTFSLTKRTLVLITPPPPPPPHPHQQTLIQTPWLFKIGQDLCGRTRLWHPLFRNRPFPSSSPCVLDLNNLPVFHLGNEFVLHHSPTPPSPDSSLYMEKVVAASACQQGKQEVSVLLTIHISGKLALFRNGDERWTIIPEMPTPYDDVCVFKGRHCAVDGTGRTVTVGSDLAMELVAEPVFGGDRKFLVESEGGLLLVDKHMSPNGFCGGDPEAEDDEDDDDDDGGGVYRVGWERAARFDVFRLDEKEKRWVEVTSLGDRILFLGDDCNFSASASDLRLGRGNCVVFKDHALECGIGVFPLDVGQVSPLSNHPDYYRLFWPRPDWIWLHCH